MAKAEKIYEYKKMRVENLVFLAQNPVKNTGVQKTLFLIDAIYLMSEAWNLVSRSTIKSCFDKAFQTKSGHL